MRISRVSLCSVALALGMSLSSVAQAQSIVLDDTSETDWRFALTGYAFLPARTEGTSTVAGSDVDLALDFSDVLDILDFAFAGKFEAWRGDWGILTDFNYVDLNASGNLELPEEGLFLDIGVDIRQIWASLLGAYRFAQGTYGSKGRKYAWDVSAGLRWNSLKQEINTTLVPGPGFGRVLGGTEEWVEPMVGLRGVYQVSEKWVLNVRLELGGFGVNGNDLQYTAAAGAEWAGWERTSLNIGYQFYGIDFSTQRSDGTFAYDVDQNGPYLGVTYRF